MRGSGVSLTNLLAGLLLALCCLLVGCGPEGSLAVPAWSLETPTPGGGGPVVLPTRLDGRVPYAASDYRLTTRVALPEALRDRPLVFGLSRFPGRVELHANGVLVPPMDASDFDRYRLASGSRFRIPAEATHGGTLDLRLTVTQGSLMSAWIDVVPTLSASPNGGRAFVTRRFVDQLVCIAAIAACFAMAFAFGSMAIVERESTAARWIVVEAIGGALYPAWTLGITQPFFGQTDIPLASMGLVTAAYASLHFTSRYLDEPRPHRAWTLALVLHGLVLVVFARPFPQVRALGPSTIVMLVACVAYHARLLVRIARERPLRINALLCVTSWPIGVACGAVDVPGVLFGVDTGVRLGSAGVVVMCMTQWTALAREHTRLRRESEALSRELAARLSSLDASFQEVDRLNHELRRQLEARGDKLATALAQRAALLGGFTVKPGDVLAERYQVQRQLGEGAMGTVFEALRITDGRKLAVKVVRSRGSTRAFARMAREAQLLARVKHPNVVEVLDVDVDVGGTVFFAMDYVEGKTLREIADAGLSLRDGVDLLGQLAAGLDAIHAAQIVHRDLKPSNVLVSTSESRRRVRIVDFGVSHQVDDSQSTPLEDPPDLRSEAAATETLGLTRDGARVGTPLYMAPEVVAGGASGFPADVYAFGLIAFEVLTGLPPTDRRTTPSLGEVVPGLAPRLAVLLDGCCRSEPAARPTARMLAETLADV